MMVELKHPSVAAIVLFNAPSWIFVDEEATLKAVPEKSIPHSFQLELADGGRFNCEYVDLTNDPVDVKFKEVWGCELVRHAGSKACRDVATGHA